MAELPITEKWLVRPAVGNLEFGMAMVTLAFLYVSYFPLTNLRKLVDRKKAREQTGYSLANYFSYKT